MKGQLTLLEQSGLRRGEIRRDQNYKLRMFKNIAARLWIQISRGNPLLEYLSMGMLPLELVVRIADISNQQENRQALDWYRGAFRQIFAPGFK